MLIGLFCYRDGHARKQAAGFYASQLRPPMFGMYQTLMERHETDIKEMNVRMKERTAKVDTQKGV